MYHKLKLTLFQLVIFFCEMQAAWHLTVLFCLFRELFNITSMSMFLL